MKKIISVLVALLMITTSLSAFAAIEVNTNSPSNAYFDDVSTYASTDGIRGSFGANGSYPVVHEYKDGAFSFSRKDGSAASGLIYLDYGREHIYDNFVFGYDIKVTGVTTDTQGSVYSNSPGTKNTVFQDYIQDGLDSGKYVVNPSASNEALNAETGKVAGYKTAWCFVKSGDSIGFGTRTDANGVILGENGQPAIFCGSAKLEQGAFYTLKVYVDQVNKKYKAIIVNADGTVQDTGLDGTVQNAFYCLNRIDSQISNTSNAGTTVTLDNLFVASSIFDMEIGEETVVNSNGTIEFLASIPSDISNPQLYINDTLVENLTIDPLNRFSDYKITATLPEGTAFGDAKVEIRGNSFGTPVSKVVNTKFVLIYYVRKYEFNKPTSTTSPAGLRRIASPGSPATVEGKDGDANGAWSMAGGEVDIMNHTTDPLTGIVEFSYDFKPTDLINALRLRMTANCNTGTGMDWHARKDGSGDPYEYFINGHPQNLAVKIGEWNNFTVNVDYYSHYYKAYLNGNLIEEDIFTDEDGVTDRTADVRLIMNGGTPIAMDNIKFVEYHALSAANPTATAKYADGSKAVYENEALNSLNVSGFEFEVPFAIDAATANGFSIVNSNGEAVDATFAYANGVVTATYAGAPLKTDDYKFIVPKTATVAGKAIGANFELPFALNGDDKVLDLDNNTALTDKVNLKVSAFDANKVVFKVNDVTVKTFAAPEADYVYEHLYAPTLVGKNIFDAYIYTDDGVNVVSSSFYYLVDAQMMNQANNVEKALEAAKTSTSELIAGAGHDGSAACKITSHVGTYQADGTTMITDTSNSCTGSFTPGGSALYRKMYTEFEIKVGPNTNISTEIGFSLTGQTYNANSSAYKTLTPPGSAPGIFSGGKILGTSTTFTPDTWYKCCQYIDFDNLVCTWNIYTGDNYETLVISNTSSLEYLANAHKGTYPDWKENIVITNKYKIMVNPSDRNIVAAQGQAYALLDNFKRYCPVDVPVVSSITADGNAVSNDVIAKGTDAITVTMNKEFVALTADKIAVTVDGEAVGNVTVVDNKTFTVSGLAGVADGKRVNIKLLTGLSVPYRNNTAAVQQPFSYDIFVGDANAICLYPISVESSDGSDLTAYAKYVNGGASDLDTFFIMTEYENDDQTLVKQTNFAPLNVKAGKVGAVSGYMTGIQKAQGCSVMLWNSDYAPLLEAGSVK